MKTFQCQISQRRASYHDFNTGYWNSEKKKQKTPLSLDFFHVDFHVEEKLYNSKTNLKIFFKNFINVATVLLLENNRGPKYYRDD